MSYKLIWFSKYGKEVIETEIPDRETAQYLKREYMMAFNEGSISIKRE